MKKSILFCLLVIPGIYSAYTQDSIAVKKLVYNTSVKTVSGGSSKGWMATIQDSALLLAEHPVRVSPYDIEPNNFQKIDYHQIYSVRIVKKGAMGRSILFGTLIGLTVGAVAGLASGDDPESTWFAISAGEKAVTAGAIGAATGCVIGAIIGALAHKTFTINGKNEKFQEMKMTIFDRLYANK